ncbi:glutamate racemase [Patescibacteria group bacterium]|nr:glutamate racemase [Patescibacteria group bacterium]
MIGIFDSGLGGLGIFKAIKKIIPEEDLYYFGDTANVPFGEKNNEELKDIILNGIKHLEEKGCNIIVLACNTASVLDINYFRKLSKVPIIAVVPVVKTAAGCTRNKKIALLATKATAKSHYTDYLIETFAPDCQVKKIPCPKLVTAIENDNISDKLIKTCLKKINKEDVIILGCTHYTLIKGQIQRIVGGKIQVIDSNEAVARQVLRVCTKEKLITFQKEPKYTFDSSGDKKQFNKLVKKYLED